MAKGAKATVPDVVGFDAVEACGMVREAGLTPYGPEYTTEPETGTVTEQEPAAAARAAPGGAVILHTGPNPAGDPLVPVSADSAELTPT